MPLDNPQKRERRKEFIVRLLCQSLKKGILGNRKYSGASWEIKNNSALFYSEWNLSFTHDRSVVLVFLSLMLCFHFFFRLPVCLSHFEGPIICPGVQCPHSHNILPWVDNDIITQKGSYWIETAGRIHDNILIMEELTDEIWEYILLPTHNKPPLSDQEPLSLSLHFFSWFHTKRDQCWTMFQLKNNHIPS